MSYRGLYEYLYIIGTGGIGGAVHYLYSVTKGGKFSFKLFMINVICAGFASYILGHFIPPSLSYRDALLGIAGFSFAKLFDIIEYRGLEILHSFLRIKMEKESPMKKDDSGEKKS